MVGRVTIFSHWVNWWKVKAAEKQGCEEGWSSLCPLAPQLALTGSGVDSMLLPVNFQAEAVHGAVGQQPIDGKFQQQRQQRQQCPGPGCRARESQVGWGGTGAGVTWGVLEGRKLAGGPLG